MVVISNENCIDMLRYNTTQQRTVRTQVTEQLPYGLNYGMFWSVYLFIKSLWSYWLPASGITHEFYAAIKTRLDNALYLSSLQSEHAKQKNLSLQNRQLVKSYF